MQGHGGDLNARARLQSTIIEMTRTIRNLYLVRSEAEGHPTILPDFERKEGEDEDTIRMHDLNTAFEINRLLGVTIAPADIRTLQGQRMRTATTKASTKNILKQLIKERRNLN
jgi:hypothetical protein